jgi:hypothetical protein
MITLFTTTKDFVGQNKINQTNAIKSWLASDYKVHIMLFGRSLGIEVFDKHPNITILDKVKTSDTGVPVINYMFDVASKLSTYPICCFLNADIILTKQFFDDILTIHQKLKRSYLVVGQRLDVDVSELLEFSHEWEESFKLKYQSKMQIHPPYGSDFFVFPKGQYTEANLPPMLVGRPAWDNYMIYDARKKRIKLIDLSKSNMVIHQNHDYSHKPKDEKQKELDEKYNFQFFPSDENAQLYLLDFCSYFLKNKSLKKNYCEKDWDKYYLRSMKFDGVSFWDRLKIRLEVRFLKYKEKIIKILKIKTLIWI